MQSTASELTRSRCRWGDTESGVSVDTVDDWRTFWPVLLLRVGRHA